MGRAWSRKAGYELWRCGGCGTVFADAENPVHLYDELYAREPPASPAHVQDSLRLVASQAEPYRRTGRWLDFGFGEGALLEAAQAAGWRCYGLEVSPPALEWGRRRGWIVSAHADDPAFPPGGFDVVSLVEVMEHVPTPGTILRSLASLVRPGGALYLTTPNVESLNRRLLGAGWSVFAPPEHLTLWSSRGLARALRRAGFEPVGIRAEGLNPVEIVARVRSARGAAAPGAEVNRLQYAQQLSASLASSPARRLAKRLANGVLSAARLGDTLKVWARRADGGNI